MKSRKPVSPPTTEQARHELASGLVKYPAQSPVEQFSGFSPNTHAALVETLRDIANAGESGPHSTATMQGLKAAARAALNAAKGGPALPAPDYRAALIDLLDQLEGVGIYIPGEDAGQWAGADGLSFAKAEAAAKGVQS